MLPPIPSPPGKTPYPCRFPGKCGMTLYTELGSENMTKAILLVLSILVGGCSRHTAPAHEPSESNPRPTAEQKPEVKTLLGKVPRDDFAMPLIAGEILPGSMQGCFVVADTAECVVALYPKGMKLPGRDVSIQVSCRIQVVTSTPPSSRENRIHMRYNQKVIVVESWKHTK
jgi:hypothetical protein